MNDNQPQSQKQSFWSKLFGGKKQQTNDMATVNPDMTATQAAPEQTTAADFVASAMPQQNSETPGTPAASSQDSTTLGDPAVDFAQNVASPLPTVDITTPTVDSMSVGDTNGETPAQPAAEFASNVDMNQQADMPQPPTDPMVTPVVAPTVDMTQSQAAISETELAAMDPATPVETEKEISPPTASQQ
jgi:hypothetical protein